MVKENELILNLKKGKTEAIPSLTFNNYFMTSYNKATLAEQVVVPAGYKNSFTIYKSLIIPVLIYCSVSSIFDKKSRADCRKSVDSCTTRIINRRADQVHAVTLQSIASIKKKHVCMFVHKCIDGKLYELSTIFQFAEPRKTH